MVLIVLHTGNVGALETLPILDHKGLGVAQVKEDRIAEGVFIGPFEFDLTEHEGLGPSLHETSDLL